MSRNVVMLRGMLAAIGALLFCFLATSVWSDGQHALASASGQPQPIYVGDSDAIQFGSLAGRAMSPMFAALGQELNDQHRFFPLYLSGTVITFSREVRRMDPRFGQERTLDEALVRVHRAGDPATQFEIIRLRYSGSRRKLHVGDEVEFVGYVTAVGDEADDHFGDRADATVTAGPNVRIAPPRPNAGAQG